VVRAYEYAVEAVRSHAFEEHARISQAQDPGFICADEAVSIVNYTLFGPETGDRRPETEKKRAHVQDSRIRYPFRGSKLPKNSV